MYIIKSYQREFTIFINLMVYKLSDDSSYKYNKTVFLLLSNHISYMIGKVKWINLIWQFWIELLYVCLKKKICSICFSLKVSTQKKMLQIFFFEQWKETEWKKYDDLIQQKNS